MVSPQKAIRKVVHGIPCRMWHENAIMPHNINKKGKRIGELLEEWVW
jgi:hypothetical protein